MSGVFTNSLNRRGPSLCFAVLVALATGATGSSGTAFAKKQARTQTLLAIATIGTMSTRVFHASGDWTVRYSTACSGTNTNFSVTSYHSDGEYGDLIENVI